MLNLFYALILFLAYLIAPPPAEPNLQVCVDYEPPRPSICARPEVVETYEWLADLLEPKFFEWWGLGDPTAP